MVGICLSLKNYHRGDMYYLGWCKAVNREDLIPMAYKLRANAFSSRIRGHNDQSGIDEVRLNLAYVWFMGCQRTVTNRN